MSAMLRVPPTYETAKVLPVGTQITYADGTGTDEYWNGQQHVKTSESTWAIMYPSTTPERIAEMVATRTNNVSPCPSRGSGAWIIEDVTALFDGMRAKVERLRTEKAVAVRNADNLGRELDRIRSVVSGDDEWIRA